MSFRAHGSRQPVTIVLSRAADALFDLCVDPAGDDALDLQVAEAGAWWIQPFATDRAGTVYGVRLLPGLPAASSPVVALTRGEATTLAPSPARFLPALLVERWLARASRRWEVALTESAWGELSALHASLGGTDGLQAARAVLEDDALYRACHEGARRRVARAEARERVDPSREREVFDRYVLEAVEDDEALVPPPDAGCWNAALASLAFVTNRQERFRGLRAAAELGAAWLMMWHPPGLDTGRSAFPDDVMSSEGGRSRLLCLAAAETLARGSAAVPPEWTTTPVWRATVALAEAGSRYDGAAHRTAAAALVLQHRPAESFQALAAASFWHRQAKGRSDDAALASAAEVARDQGWIDLADHLERLGDLRRRASAPPPPPPAPPVQVSGVDQIFDLAEADDDERNVVRFVDLPVPATAGPSAGRSEKGERRRRSKAKPPE